VVASFRQYDVDLVFMESTLGWKSESYLPAPAARNELIYVLT
jgi:hypothetical protein